MADICTVSEICVQTKFLKIFDFLAAVTMPKLKFEFERDGRGREEEETGVACSCQQRFFYSF